MCSAHPTLALIKSKYFKTYKLETLQLKRKHCNWSANMQSCQNCGQVLHTKFIWRYIINIKQPCKRTRSLLFFKKNTIFITIQKILRKNLYELYPSEKVQNLVRDVDGSGHPVLATLQYGRGILEIKGCGWGVSDHINRQQKGTKCL